MLYPKQEKQLAKVKRYVERELDIPDISDRCRDNAHVIARTLYYYLATKHTFISMNQVAKYIGRTHASLINAMQEHKLEWSLEKVPNHIIRRFKLKERPRKINPKYFLEMNPKKYKKMDKLTFAAAYHNYRLELDKKLEKL